jgi:hypothetical protein
MSITSGATAMTAVAWGARVIGASEGTVAGHVEAATEAPEVDDAPSARCTASGWRLRVACTDGSGAAICPACGRRVGASPDHVVGPGVWMIQEHGA